MTINQLYSELQEQQEIAKHGTAHDQNAAIERIKELEEELKQVKADLAEERQQREAMVR